MAVYIDHVHMVADTLEELHKFAKRISVTRSFFHGTRKGHPHYDLTQQWKIDKAIKAGALVVDSKMILLKSKSLSRCHIKDR